MHMTNFLENKLIDQLFRGVAYTFPSTLYFAAFTAAPSDAGGGTEVSGNSYARVAVACSTANFASTGGAGTTTNPSAGTTGTTSNNGLVSFPTPSGAWGTVTHGAIFDSASGGNMLIWAPLTTSLDITSAATPLEIPISAFTFQIDN